MTATPVRFDSLAWTAVRALAVAACLIVVAASAQAQQLRFAGGDPLCMSALQLRERVRSRWQDLPEDVAITVEALPATRPARALRLRIEVSIDSQSAERELEASRRDCAALQDAVALVAVMLARTLEPQTGSPTSPPIASGSSDRSAADAQLDGSVADPEPLAGPSSPPAPLAAPAPRRAVAQLPAAQEQPRDRDPRTSPRSPARSSPLASRPVQLPIAQAQAAPDPVHDSTEVVESEQDPRERRTAEWLLGLGAGIRNGFSPNPTPWPYLNVGLRWRGLGSLELRGGAAWPQRLAIAEGQLELSAYSLGLGVCVVPLRPVPGLSLCADAHGGFALATARHFSVENRTRSHPMLFLAMRLEFEIEALRLGGGRVSVWADGGSVVIQPRFVVYQRNGVDEAGSMGASRWSAAMGALYSFAL
jgi:hypothetical protein